ncbi:hypothetical protein TruAng_002913 [Truncatella angustata]|nr:hypothetical protein TruAng_002913 [Truncatella angustata]
MCNFYVQSQASAYSALEYISFEGSKPAQSGGGIMEPNRDDPVTRRRIQNRLAQRRFRWRKDQQKSALAAAKQLKKQNNVEEGQADLDGSAAYVPAPVLTASLSEPVAPPDSSNIHEANAPNATARASATRCRFVLFGNSMLLKSNFWSKENLSKATTASFAELNVTSLPTPQTSERACEQMGHYLGKAIPATYQSVSGSSESSHTPNTFAEARFSAGLQSPPANSNVVQGGVPGPTGPSHRPEPASPSDRLISHPTVASVRTMYPSEGHSVKASSSHERSWQSPLHIATQKGHDRIVRVLLQHGMDCNEEDSDGLTPLYYAVKSGFEGIVASLIEHGARMDWDDGQRRSALHFAVLENREGVLKVMLEHCADNPALINSYDNAGMTPLHTAVDIGFEAGVQLLLEHGANLSYKARKN